MTAPILWPQSHPGQQGGRFRSESTGQLCGSRMRQKEGSRSEQSSACVPPQSSEQRAGRAEGYRSEVGG